MVRLKNRWILFELVEDPVIQNDQVSFPRTTFGVTEEDITSTIRQAVSVNYGDFGSGMVWSAGVKWYNPETRMGILRVPRDYLDMYLATLFFIKHINNIPCGFQIHHVSGTIIFIQKTAIQRDADLYLQEKARMEAKGQAYSVVDKIEASERQIKQSHAVTVAMGSAFGEPSELPFRFLDTLRRLSGPKPDFVNI